MMATHEEIFGKGGGVGGGGASVTKQREDLREKQGQQESAESNGQSEKLAAIAYGFNLSTDGSVEIHFPKLKK